MYNICLCFDSYIILYLYEPEIKAENAWILLQVKFFLYFIPTKFEHSSRSIGRILLQLKFFLYFSEQHVHTIQELSNEFVMGKK